jgi:hypothetical protein
MAGMIYLLCLLGLSLPRAIGLSLPLFAYEESPLTSSSLEHRLESLGIADYAGLFAFDNGTDVDPNRRMSGECKVFPGDTDWPSSTTWAVFDKLLDGALIKTTPIAAPCYQNLGVYDAAKCAALRSNFTNPYLQ